MTSNTGSYCQCHVTGLDIPATQETHPYAVPHPRQLPLPPQQPPSLPLQRFAFKNPPPNVDKNYTLKKSRWRVSKAFLKPALQVKEVKKGISNEVVSEVNRARPPQSLAVSGLSGSAHNVQRFCTCPRTTSRLHSDVNSSCHKYGDDLNAHGMNSVDRKIRFWSKLGLGRDPAGDIQNSTLNSNTDTNMNSRRSERKHRTYSSNNNNDDDNDNEDYDDDVMTGKSQQSTHRCCPKQQCAYLSDSLSSALQQQQQHNLQHHHHHHHHRFHGNSCLFEAYHGGVSSFDATTSTTSDPAEQRYRSFTRKKKDLNSRSSSMGSSSTSFETIEGGQHRARNTTLGLLAKPFRLIVCILSAQVLAVTIFFWMFLGLGYSFPLSASLSALLAALLGLFLSASKHLRCTAVIIVPSVATSRGRLGVVLLIGGLLVGGPIKNVYFNVTEISRSLACSQEQSYHHLEILLLPYDHMMLQLNGTIWKLQMASESVRKSLRPLHARLDGLKELRMEERMTSQQGPKKTCKILVEEAHEACMTGIQKAQDQCFEVMGALGTVYHHARVVLDRINPDRWSNRQTSNPHSQQLNLQYNANLPYSQNYLEGLDYPSLNHRHDFALDGHVPRYVNGSVVSGAKIGDDYYHHDEDAGSNHERKNEVEVDGSEHSVDESVRKRTASEDNSSAFIEELDLAGSDRDICEPLDTRIVCQNLNDSDTLCRLSDWAGEIIQEAINSTQAAIKDLKFVLQFREPYAKLRNESLKKSEGESKGNPSSDALEQKRFKGDVVFKRMTQHFVTFLVVLERLLPLGMLVIIYAAYCYIREYRRNVTFDNYFMTTSFKNIDRSRMTSTLNSKQSGLNPVSTTHTSLFPLKNYEKLFVIDATAMRMSHREKHMWRVGMCLYFLFLIVTVVLYLFDYLICWLLKLASSDVKVNLGSSENSGVVVDGNGVWVDFLDIFVREFYPRRLFKTERDDLRDSTNQQQLKLFCLPTPSKPNSIVLSLVIVAQTSFFCIIFLKARLFRARNMLVGYFYNEKERIRLGYLHSALARQRANLAEILHRVARSNHRRYHSSQNCFYNYCSCCPTGQDFSWRVRDSVLGDTTSPCNIAARQANSLAGTASTRSRLCLKRIGRILRRLMRPRQKCFVCSDASKRVEKITCPTDGCCGHYCATCFYDMNRLCPLCLQGDCCHDDDRQGTSGSTKVEV